MCFTRAAVNGLFFPSPSEAVEPAFDAKAIKVFGLVGLYSYGLYLIHQPYVIWLGLRIREVPIWMFLLICIPTLVLLSAWGMLLEKATNTLVNKLVWLRKPVHT